MPDDGPKTPQSRTVLGCILTREWRDEPSGARLEIWASTEDGPVKLVFEDVEPVMFARRADLARVSRDLPTIPRVAEVPLKSLDGSDVHALYFKTRRGLERCREWLGDQGVECLEADVPPAERFLMERFVRGTFQASGLTNGGGAFGVFSNPRIRHADYRPRLGVMSLDIETSPRADEIYSIAYATDDVQRVLMRGDAGATDEDFELVPCADEREILSRFISDTEQLDPDVLIGWNVINFDLSVLHRRCDALKVPLALGRDRSPARLFRTRHSGLNAVARVPGRVVLDGIECLRSAFWTFESFALEAVARELLGRGKAISGERDRAGEITRLFEHDKRALARYNIEDCRLVLDIFEATDLLEFVVERTRLTGLAMGRQGGSVAAFDYLYLPRLHRRGWVAPSLSQRELGDTSPGGYVLDSVPGIHENVAVLDFKSLYPSIIRTFRIDPLGLAQPGDDPVPGFLGARFAREESLLPDIIEELWQRRDEAKRDGNQPLSQAVKILMNSFYGVLGTDGCRFYDPRLASSITRRGHDIIRTSRRWIEERGFKVIYGDTDSLFLLLDDGRGDLNTQARALVEELNERWREEIAREYRLHSYLEIELETLFEKFFMPRIRGGDTGSKKRYAGITGSSPDTLVIKGLEAVRSDWTELARCFQRELLYAVFRELDVESLVQRYVSLVRSGRANDQLIYRKRLRRPLDAYRKHLPPHVRAARQLDEPGQEIRYFITESGPQPVERCDAPPDFDHYIERQIKPVAAAILPFVGLDFDRIVGGQGDLFE